MSGDRQARRDAAQASRRADEAVSQLQKEREENKRRQKEERMKAQRVLLRSIRSGAGGMFETESSTGSSLGGSGALN